jgi:hypothetical protein
LLEYPKVVTTTTQLEKVNVIVKKVTNITMDNQQPSTSNNGEGSTTSYDDVGSIVNKMLIILSKRRELFTPIVCIFV